MPLSPPLFLATPSRRGVLLATTLALCTGGRVLAQPSLSPSARLKQPVTPVAYRLDLTVTPERVVFDGRAEIDIALSEPLKAIWINGLGLNVSALELRQNGKVIDAEWQDVRADGLARIDLETVAEAGTATIIVAYQGRYRTGPDGMWRVRDGTDWYCCTQFQPMDARRVFPGFDQPEFKTPFDVTLRTRETDTAISNQKLKESARDANTGLMVHRFETTLPLPTYLLLFAVGPFDIVEGPTVAPSHARTHAVPIRGIARRGQGAKMAYVLAAAEKIIPTLEQDLQTPFVWSKLDLIAAPGMTDDGMENAGAIVMEEQHLFLQANSPLDARRYGLEILVHEIAHHWFGNLVTLDWWSDLWLNEAFAERLGVKIANQIWPEMLLDQSTLLGMTEALQTERVPESPSMRREIERAGDVPGAFNALTYQKGAQILAMLEGVLGEPRWQSVLATYLDEFRFKSVSRDDFYSVLSRVGGPDMKTIAKSYIEVPGTPLIRVHQKTFDTIEVKLASDRSGAPAWTVPVRVAWTTPRGPEQRDVLLGNQHGMAKTLTLNNRAKATPLALNPDGSLYWTYGFTRAQDWLDVIAGLKSAPPGQAIIAAESLWDAFRRSEVTLPTLKQAADALILNPHPDAALAMGHHLAWLADAIAPAAKQADFRAWASESCKSGQNRFAKDISPEARELMLLGTNWLLIHDFQDQSTILEQADMAEGFLKAPTEAVSDDDLRGNLVAGVLRNQNDFASRLFASVDVIKDASVRSHVAYALGQTDDETVTEAIRTSILDDDFYTQDMLAWLESSLTRAGMKDPIGIYPWLDDKAEAFLKLIPGFSRLHAVGLFDNNPSPEAAKFVAGTLATILTKQKLGRNELNQTLRSMAEARALAARLQT